jgi:outer membrane usher protein
VPGLWGLEFGRKPPRGSSGDFVGSPRITLLRRSNIEVYVNGSLMKTRTNVAPGSYTLDDIPYVYGSNDVRIKITDDSGRERVLDTDIFLDSSFLGKGEMSFGLTAGYPESSDRTKGRYDRKNPLVSGFVRYGLSNALECMLGAQRSKIGGSVTTGMRHKNRFGLFEVKCARSRYGESRETLNGTVFYASYVSPTVDLANLKTGFSIFAEKADTFFYPYLGDSAIRGDSSSDTFLNRRENLKGKNSSIYGRVFFNDLCGLNLSFGHGVKNRPDRGRERSFSANITRYISGNGGPISHAAVNCCFESRHSPGRKADRSFGISCSISLKDNTVISGTCTAFGEKNCRFSVSNRPPNNGFGYSCFLDRTPYSKSCLAEACYRHARFRTDFSHRLGNNSSNRTCVGFESGLFFADGVFGVSGNRMYDGGFVIVRPKNAIADESIKFLDSSGESGGLGGGAVLHVSKGAVSSVRLDLSELPDGIEVKRDVITSYGYYRRGGLVEISAEGNMTAGGILHDERGKPLGLVGGFAVNATDPNVPPVRFFTNPEGKFVINGLKPGKYKASVNVECCDDFEIEVPESESRILDLGIVVCRDCNEND